MSAVAQRASVARANFAERKKGMTKLLGHCRKRAELIRAIVEERVTYGYRRVCVLETESCGRKANGHP